MSEASNTPSRLWWLPWRLKASNERKLDQLQRHGLTDADRRLFVALCRSGRPTPDWLAERMISAAEWAKASEKESERGL